MPSPTPHPSPQRIAVIGGGFAGLAAAHRIGELTRERGTAATCVLYEAGPRLGGVVETRRIGDYLVELGADSFITNKPWALDLCRRLGVADRLIPTESRYRRSLVLRRGRPVPVPDGFMLLAPARIWPVLASPIFSPLGKLRMGVEPLIPRRRDNGDESLASFVRRRLGRQALDRLIQPLVGGIYTSDPEKLSLAATLPRFLEMEQQVGSVVLASLRQGRAQPREQSESSGARYGLFAAPVGGMSELLDSLIACVRGSADVRTGCRVNAIERTAEAKWRVAADDGTTEEFDGLILATPAFRSADLLDPIDPPLAASLRQIEYASSAVVITAHKLTDVRHPLDAFGLVVPAIERRRVLAVSCASRKFPGRAPEGHVLLRTFVGGAMQPEMLALSDEELVRIVRDELAGIFGVTGAPEFSVVARYQRGMPQYHVGHLERVAAIGAAAARHPGLALAGNAYHGVGVPDVIHSGEQAAGRLLGL